VTPQQPSPQPAAADVTVGTLALPARARYRSLDDPESLRELARNLREGIYITNRTGEILDANQAFLEMFGFHSLDELRAVRARDLLLDPGLRERELATLDREGSLRDFEFEVVRPDGETRTVLDTCYICRDPDTGETFFHGILIDITPRKELERQLRDLSLRDALTGCHNRRYLAELAQRMVERNAADWGCIFIDIDHFKDYNDQRGHQAGDDVLVRMSRFLIRQVRAEEAVVRVGGDEFLLVLEGANEERTEHVARRLQYAALRGAPVPFSLGWSSRENDESFESTIDRADRELLKVRVAERGDDARRG
jgi:diguanylate cyclase (GGDEF)-like protein/PAS domain S-box-containing protein